MTSLKSGDYVCYLVSSQTEKTATDWQGTGKWSSDKDANGVSSAVQTTTTGVLGKVDQGEMFTSVNFDVTLTSDTYYYLVFVGKTDDTYAITSGTKYVPDSASEDGFTTLVPPPGVMDEVTYVDHTWIYSNVRGTPEPTVFGLIAFGLAGLALRRRKVCY